MSERRTPQQVTQQVIAALDVRGGFASHLFGVLADAITRDRAATDAAHAEEVARLRERCGAAEGLNSRLRQQAEDVAVLYRNSQAEVTRLQALLETAQFEAQTYIDAHNEREAEVTRLRAELAAARAVVVAFVRDRAEQYDQGSGICTALLKVAAAIGRGEHEEAHVHGELDDLLPRAQVLREVHALLRSPGVTAGVPRAEELARGLAAARDLLMCMIHGQYHPAIEAATTPLHCGKPATRSERVPAWVCGVCGAVFQVRP